MRKAEIKMHANAAGWLVQYEEGFLFTYAEAYLNSEHAEAVSLTLNHINWS